MSVESGSKAKRGIIIFAGLLAVWTALTIVQWRLFETVQGGGMLGTVVIFGLVNLNILLLLLLLFLTLRNVAKLLLERRLGVLGARLKTKLVLAFLGMAVIPTAILYLASAGFLARSIETLFSGHIENALSQSLEVARAYYETLEKDLLEYSRGTAESITVNGVEKTLSQKKILPESWESRIVSMVEIVSQDGKILGRIDNPNLMFPKNARLNSKEGRIPPAVRESAELIRSPVGDYIRAAVPIFDKSGKIQKGMAVVYGYAPGNVLGKLDEITKGFQEYRQLEVLKAPIKASYMLPLLLVALLIVFAAIWFGFHLTKGIIDPIQDLAEATNRVAGGDLDFQIEVGSLDEVGILVDSFNRMTLDLKAEIETAQTTLRKTNEELDQRRRYMEVVLGRVTAGVLSIDKAGKISTANAAAQELLNIGDEVVGRPYRRALPNEIAEVATKFMQKLGQSSVGTVQNQITVNTGEQRRVFMIHMTRLTDESGAPLGAVAVFDDLTELMRAQRAQAWQEVARRIAHEIKNPLTPIRLSAQRLRRKYSRILDEQEGEVLDEATRTIIAQVDSLKSLVDEFSRFAKMPESKPAPEDLNAVVEEVVSLYRPSHTRIRFEVRLDDSLPIIEVDASQVKRALVNLLDNAVSALKGSEHGLIEIFSESDNSKRAARIVVADNGPGLSRVVRDRLFEPYFSTKKEGTGLGLAIVKSIVADHRGYVRAMDNKPHGARFILEFPFPGANE